MRSIIRASIMRALATWGSSSRDPAGLSPKKSAMPPTRSAAVRRECPRTVCAIPACSRHYRIEKELISDPARPVLLQRNRFTALGGTPTDYRLHVLLAPHLANRGSGNTAWIGEYKGVPMLFAERAGTALALACSEAVVESFGRIRRQLRWLAGSARTPRDDLELHPRRERQRGVDGRDRASPRRRRVHAGARVRPDSPRKRDIARAPHCTMVSTPRTPSTCATGMRGRTGCCVSTSTGRATGVTAIA